MSEGTQTRTRIQSYDEFWPVYLREHLNPISRALHYIGSSWAIVCLILLFMTGNLVWLLAGFVGAYGLAWIGHFGFEKNRPATFQYPLWSFVSDWRMFGRFLSGRLASDLDQVRDLPALKDL